jgi:peptide deformylase
MSDAAKSGEHGSVSGDLKDLRIIHYPDPRLREKSAPVTDFGAPLAALIERMVDLMESGKGVGLAAPQVGVNQRFFIMSFSGKKSDLQVVANPALHEPSGSVEAEEGCLSLPGVDVRVRRAQQIRVTAQDLQGRPYELELTDLPARIVQHEYDHLNGTLIIDRMGPTDRIAMRKTLRALEDNYTSQSRGRPRKAASR